MTPRDVLLRSRSESDFRQRQVGVCRFAKSGVTNVVPAERLPVLVALDFFV